MKNPTRACVFILLFLASISGCTNTTQKKPGNEPISENAIPVHQIETDAIGESTNTDTNPDNESPVDINVEDIPPPCIYSDGSSRVTMSPQSIFYTLGDNRIFHIDIDEALSNVGAYQPEQLIFDEVYQFQDIDFAPAGGGQLVILDIQGEILLMQEGDTELHNLTDEVFSNAHAVSISPNGEWIGIMYDLDYITNYYDITKIRLINRENGEQIRMENDSKGYSVPIWSSSGEEIAYHVYDDNSSQIHVMDLDTRKESLISEPRKCHVNLAWSQDGNSLVYNTTSSYYPESAELFITEIESRISNLLFKIDPSYHFIDHITGWSPSGELIMFESIRNPNGPTVCIASANGKEISCPFLTAEKNIWTIPFWMPDDQIGVVFFDTSNPPDFRNLQFNRLEVLTPPHFGE